MRVEAESVERAGGRLRVDTGILGDRNSGRRLGRNTGADLDLTVGHLQRHVEEVDALLDISERHRGLAENAAGCFIVGIVVARFAREQAALGKFFVNAGVGRVAQPTTAMVPRPLLVDAETEIAHAGYTGKRGPGIELESFALGQVCFGKKSGLAPAFVTESRTGEGDIPAVLLGTEGLVLVANDYPVSDADRSVRGRRRGHLG